METIPKNNELKTAGEYMAAVRALPAMELDADRNNATEQNRIEYQLQLQKIKVYELKNNINNFS